jgi:hypothetical protein
MGMLLMVVGCIWAALGAAKIIGVSGQDVTEGVMLFIVIANFVLFILPGLITTGFGKMLRNKKGEK